MPNNAHITLRAVDNNGHQLFQHSVPFGFEISVKQLMEQAFSLAQTSTTPDPFLYTVEYYGYSESAQFPGYLGYEIESINGLPTNQKFYWELLINGVSSSTGADTTYPSPGSTVLWQYTAIPATPQELAARTRVVHSRRAARTVVSRH